MTRPTPSYRLLTEKDAAIFRELRTRGCHEEPGSFLMTGEEMEALPDKNILRFFSGSWIAGAFIDGELVGITGLTRNKGIKTRHKGTVWGVYVAPEARGLGCGRAMIGMVLNEAEQAGMEAIMLSTDVTNSITVSLYKELGFEPYGIERHILKLEDGRYVDDVWMIKFLKQDKAA